MVSNKYSLVAYSKYTLLDMTTSEIDFATHKAQQRGKATDINIAYV